MSAEPMEESPLLRMHQVAVGSGLDPGAVLIEEVGWTVDAGDFWAVGGLPGAGKSELLLTAAGLMPPEKGEVRLFGHRFRGVPEQEWSEVRQRVGFVFPHGGRLFNRLTVAENLDLPICYHANCRPGENRSRVERVLELTELGDWADHRPDRIPRNLHQRVGLARALVLMPELLVLDNPLAGLDPRQIRWWLDFLSRIMAKPSLLNRAKLTLIISADNIGPWRELARCFGIIHERRWIPLGSADELTRAAHPATRDLLF